MSIEATRPRGATDDSIIGGAAPPQLTLLPHRAFPPAWRGSLAAVVALDAGATLDLSFRLSGDTARLRLPAFATVRRGDRLWEHTCFEAFLAVADRSGYVEVNFAPSGEWAAYGFIGYREGMTPIGNLAPELAVGLAPERFELTARVRLGHLLGEATMLRLGLSAVIEDAGGGRSYWALRHGADKLDFHDPDSFALEIPLAGAGAAAVREGSRE